ncbi:AIPR family protein [Luteimonas qiangzhengi]|uniref:AIPR family protein n=1 Tax=Luteimonas sp. MJ146 TaxID=3129240 RepID=UPI0031BB22AB
MYVTPGQKWQAAYTAAKTNFGLNDDAIGAFAIQLRFNLDDIKLIAAEALTGGGNDRKCDVLHVDKEMGIAVIAQCYVAQNKKKAAKSNKAADLNTAVSWLLSANIANLDPSLSGRAQELRDAVRAGDINQIHCWYVHNLPTSKNVRAELDTVEQTVRSALSSYNKESQINVFAKEVGADEIESLYTKAERTIIVTDTFQVQVPDVLEHKHHDGTWSSISTFVPGRWLADLYAKYETDLFSANLRGYLGSRASDKNINNGIKRTTSQEPDNFLVYNNGVTSLVLDYKYSGKTKKGRKLNITGLSIVNGAQTTGSIASAKGGIAESLLVGIRFVKADSDDLIEKIVKYNNSQNKLEAADFRSNDAVQDRLRHEFSSIPDAEYEGGRRGGASDAIKRSKYTLPSYTVGQSLAAFHGDPVLAYDKKSEIWIDDKNYGRVFTDRTSARHIVFCFSIQEAVARRRLILMEKNKSDPSTLTDLEKTTLDFLNRKGSQFLFIYIIAKCLETIVGKPIPNKFDLRFKANGSPFSLAEEWGAILDIILPLSGQLDGAFAKGRITNEGVKKTAPNFVGVFASIANLQQPTFKLFASKVEIA